MQKLGNPIPIFSDGRGLPMDGGRIYVGVANDDPEASPLDLFWDAALTIPAEQPLRTLGGMIVDGITPADVFFADDDFSIRLRDSNNVQVAYVRSLYTTADSFQPASAELSLLAALTSTAFGRSMLTLANSAALKAATGIPDPLPAIGGNVTGNIIRSGAGVHPYWADAAMTGGRIYITAVGASDPTSQPGDIWFTY